MITRDEAMQMAREANRWAANQTDDSYDFQQIRDERLVQAAYQRGLEDAAERMASEGLEGYAEAILLLGSKP